MTSPYLIRETERLNHRPPRISSLAEYRPSDYRFARRQSGGQLEKTAPPFPTPVRRRLGWALSFAFLLSLALAILSVLGEWLLAGP
jgi:hypothetical protein